jgi:hypothetical protein
MSQLDVPEVGLIGAGRIGTALALLANDHGAPIPLWQRLTQPALRGTEACGLQELAAGTPLLLCSRNDQLADILAALPPERRADAVLVQNGMLRSFLAEQGLSGLTRGLLFFAVNQRGERPVPGGVNPLCGPHAVRVARWLCSLGLQAKAVSAPEFAAIEVEKLLWNSVFGLLCQVYQQPVSQVALAHEAEVVALVHELLPVALTAAPEAIGLLGQAEQEQALTHRLCAYSAELGGYQASVKEWPWRNGWFVTAAQARDLSTPIHDQWLRQIGR